MLDGRYTSRIGQRERSDTGIDTGPLGERYLPIYYAGNYTLEPNTTSAPYSYRRAPVPP